MEELYLTKKMFIGREEVVFYSDLCKGLTIWESKALNKFYIVDEFDNVVCILFSDDAIDVMVKTNQKEEK